MTVYKIHGDNIVECERIAEIILNALQPEKIFYSLSAPSTISVKLKSKFENNFIDWELILLPGFNKNTKKRWRENIFDSLKAAGSYLDETPDAIITKIDSEENESILAALEFCSALQAGNQAWQRSARAFSTGRAGCPYIYAVDFVKYELDNSTRERKSLRFPNAAVPYSYINFAKNTGNFISQLYLKSEEFDKTKEKILSDFDEENFGNKDLGIYLIKKMLGLDTKEIENLILKKNMNVVKFISKKFDDKTNFSADDWEEIYKNSSSDIVRYSIEKNRFNFHKKIAAKSQSGKISEIVSVADKLSVGFASRDLPFGIIPADKRKIFSEKIFELYPNINDEVAKKIGSSEKNLVVAIFKGFKPRGDDNRPDRGILPLAVMLSNEETEILSFIYGPITETNLELLNKNPCDLAKKNGLWKTILSLSNFLILDVPVISREKYNFNKIYDNNSVKKFFSCNEKVANISSRPKFSDVPINFGEDDADTAIHYFFKHILRKICFEGMCNPPGGDWSGFSLICGDTECRWLSLPRISNTVGGKRPDHILQINGAFDLPLLLIIESKEFSADLEENVGEKLSTYVKNLMNYVPSVQRKIFPSKSDWTWGDKIVNFDDFEVISAAAYLREHAEKIEEVLKKNCEILFILNPTPENEKIMWEMEIVASTKRGEILKEYLIKNYKNSNDLQFRIT